MLKLLKKTNLWRGLAATTAVLFGILVGITTIAIANDGMVNNFLGIRPPTIAGGADTQYYPSEFTASGVPDDGGLAAIKAASLAHIEQELEEGSVLLKNNGALPLAGTERSVTLFGRASADIVYKNKTPGAQIAEERVVDLKAALEGRGFEINETIYNAYAGSATARNWETGDIGEEESGFYNSMLTSSYANDYNDAAIVVLSRYGGEDADFKVSDTDGVPQLSLHKDEADLLKMIENNGKFGKTIVLINSGNAMDLSWLDKSEYGVDACLWIGLPGLSGLNGVADLLIGEENPSGKLVDAYATSSLSSPAMSNFGSFTFSGSNQTYLIKSENIYTGYKYYESRYYDAMLGQFNASSAAGRSSVLSEGGQDIQLYTAGQSGWDYGAEMAYPFGYGLSYTTFTQEIVEGSFKYDAETDKFTVDVLVTNTGDCAGKSVVQLYVSLPYTDYDREHGVEKSAIQLAGFAKTDELAASGEEGDSQMVTIEVDRYLIASYDVQGAAGYILDAGDYYFAIGDDVHDALNNVLAAQKADGVAVTGTLIDHNGTEVAGDASKTAKYTLDALDTSSYRYSPYTEEQVEVTNKFVGDYSVDINDFLAEADKITYLTRGSGDNDWSTSFPSAITNLALTSQMSAVMNSTYSTPSGAPAADSITRGEYQGIKFVEMKDVDFDDEKWDTFIDQFEISDLRVILDDSSGIKIAGEGTFVRPASYHTDGPDGTSRTFSDGTRGSLFSAAVVAASSWNTDLVLRRGQLIAEECMCVNAHMIWGPGATLHRTPYNGRNCEYYSEDPIVSYYMSIAQCKGTSEKGILCSIKHYFANSQETNRKGVATFATEQVFREGEMKGFEGAVTEGGTLALMNSLNRIGLVMATENRAALKDILREEWAFKGLVTSDAYTGEADDYLNGLANGTDTWCLNSSVSNTIIRNITSDGNLLQCLKNSNKYVTYAFSRSTLVNGLTPETELSGWIPWWQSALTAIDAVFGVLTVGFAALCVTGIILKAKEKRV